MTKMLKTSPVNRKCAFPGCEHTLSIYNHQEFCHIHLDKMPQDKKHNVLPQPVESVDTV
ncbi:MAG: hypothetical protein KJ757_07255 [Planctomycetes bacterium]|nr:hypothetical protein [Planctomycetota bacterium]MBU1517499.1 hypothetical protein [Planctomycetota bacterium]MBU2457011.1 hypothetical protein [Planctomycetota bacterium]MBU2597338.1 hypothetical protein [Planctomycetota bacterium]